MIKKCLSCFLLPIVCYATADDVYECQQYTKFLEYRMKGAREDILEAYYLIQYNKPQEALRVLQNADDWLTLPFDS